MAVLLPGTAEEVDRIMAKLPHHSMTAVQGLQQSRRDLLLQLQKR